MNRIMETGIIYVATNKINGKQYVGQTKKTLNERIRAHIKSSKTSRRTYFQKAINKYGIDNFLFESFIVTTDKLNINEIQMIKKLNCKAKNGYNLTIGGEGSKGYKHTNEARAKMGTTKGLAKSEEHKQKIAKGRLGKKHTNETKLKISQQHLGKKRTLFTKETVMKMSEGAKKGWKKRFKTYIFKDVYGVAYTSQGGFVNFCKEYKLCPRNMYYAMKDSNYKHKGWTVSRKPN